MIEPTELPSIAWYLQEKNQRHYKRWKEKRNKLIV